MKKIFTLFATLLMACLLAYSQDIIVKNDGSVINAYRTDYQGQFVYYQTEDTDEAPILRIKKEDILVIRLADGTAITPNATQPEPSNDKPAVEQRDFPDIDLTGYHGFLLDKGNSVYVAYNSNVNYEKAAVEAIKQAITEDGLWQVVDKPSQAHFILQYNVCLTGRDFARLILRPRENYQKIQYLDIGGWSGPDPNAAFFICGGDYGSDEVEQNINVAHNIIVHVLQDYKTMLESSEFMESVKTGNYLKSKSNREKWYYLDYVTVRYEAKAVQIKLLHDIFYR